MVVIPDDKEDQEAGKGNNTVEDQVGEQQPGPASNGRGGELLIHEHAHTEQMCPKSTVVSEKLAAW